MQKIKEKKEYYSQIGQDKWVLDCSNHKKGGFFIEVGASDGIELSNTFLLEKEFEWNGICIEPSRQFEELEKNRTCICDNSVVFSNDGEEVTFIEDYKYGEKNLFSGIEKTIDKHKVEGVSSKRKTISLNSLLTKHKAPKTIDYLSIDTEGSELHILLNFPFEKWDVKLITVEHNNNQAKRESIFKLLSKHGFIRDLSADSKWDDWYYHISILKSHSPYFFKSGNKLDELRNQLEKEITNNYSRSEQIKFQNLAITELESKIHNYEILQDDLKLKISHYEKLQEEFEEKIRVNETRQSELLKSNIISDVTQTNENIHQSKEFVDLKIDNAELKIKLEFFDKHINALKNQVSEFKGEKEKMSSRLKSEIENHQVTQNQILKENFEKQKLHYQLEVLKEQIDKKENLIQNRDSEINSLNASVLAKNSEIKKANEIINRYETTINKNSTILTDLEQTLHKQKRKYKKLKSASISNHQKETKKHNKKISFLKNALGKLEDEAKHYHLKFNKLNNLILEKDEAGTKLNLELVELKGQLKTLEDEKLMLEQARGEIESDNSTLKTKLNSLQEKAENQKINISNLENLNSSLEQEKSQFVSQVDTLQNNIDSLLKKSEFQELNIANLENLNSSLEQEKSQYVSQVDTLQNKIDSLLKKSEFQELNIANLEKLNSSLEQEKSQYVSQVDTLQNKIDSLIEKTDFQDQGVIKLEEDILSLNNIIFNLELKFKTESEQWKNEKELIKLKQKDQKNQYFIKLRHLQKKVNQINDYLKIVKSNLELKQVEYTDLNALHLAAVAELSNLKSDLKQKNIHIVKNKQIIEDLRSKTIDYQKEMKVLRKTISEQNKNLLNSENHIKRIQKTLNDIKESYSWNIGNSITRTTDKLLGWTNLLPTKKNKDNS